MASPSRRLASVTVSGPDRKGIVARFATFLFQNNINIDDIDQHAESHLFVMTMRFDLAGYRGAMGELERGLRDLGRALGMDVRFRLEREHPVKNIAVLVTREPHGLDRLLRDSRAGRVRGRVRLVIGNRRDLEPRCRRAGVPFRCVPSSDRARAEKRIAGLLKTHDIDLLVLARYMQILSPAFVFLYQGKIVNIHPSLLPAFPGPRAYTQAFDTGVGVAGCTAHFVTTDLDRGPIIAQEAFRVDKARHTLEDIVRRGRALEARVLSRAVRLYCADRLILRKGKVIWR